jgi:DUF1365 family protein
MNDITTDSTRLAHICFGRVRHARLRPTTHSFDYGVYFMRFPLRAMAQQVGENNCFFSYNRFNLLSFWDKDHGDGKQPLITWIDALLKHEGIDDADGEIWLQAFPRVLGYVFNPVAFWFCHNKEGKLRAVLAEVRNTFGERHCYLLDVGDTMPYGIELQAHKVFHVSPFCAVDGNYRFRFMRTHRDMVGSAIEWHIARIDHDDDIGPLIETSISGTSYPVADRLIAKALFLYPLMTFGVVAKIHWQALKLWRKRVPFFRKPHPPSCDLSR